jgi:hypothetical protein
MEIPVLNFMLSPSAFSDHALHQRAFSRLVSADARQLFRSARTSSRCRHLRCLRHRAFISSSSRKAESAVDKWHAE